MKRAFRVHIPKKGESFRKRRSGNETFSSLSKRIYNVWRTWFIISVMLKNESFKANSNSMERTYWMLYTRALCFEFIAFKFMKVFAYFSSLEFVMIHAFVFALLFYRGFKTFYSLKGQKNVPGWMWNVKEMKNLKVFLLKLFFVAERAYSIPCFDDWLLHLYRFLGGCNREKNFLIITNYNHLKSLLGRGNVHKILNG